MKTLKMQRDFAAPPSVLFRAVWDGTLFVCCGFASETMKIDFNVGGKYRMQYKSETEVSGEFVEIVQDERVVFTWSEMNTKVIVEIRPRDAGSVLTITHELIPDAQWFERFKGGWTVCINSLTKKLAS